MGFFSKIFESLSNNNFESFQEVERRGINIKSQREIRLIESSGKILSSLQYI